MVVAEFIPCPVCGGHFVVRVTEGEPAVGSLSSSSQSDSSDTTSNKVHSEVDRRAFEIPSDTKCNVVWRGGSRRSGRRSPKPAKKNLLTRFFRGFVSLFCVFNNSNSNKNERPSEFQCPRAQENGVQFPEVMDFIGSQKLYNPYGTEPPPPPPPSFSFDFNPELPVKDLDNHSRVYVHKAIKAMDSGWESIKNHFAPRNWLGEDDINNFIRLAVASHPQNQRYAWLLTEAAGMDKDLYYSSFLENYSSNTECLIIPHLKGNHYMLWFYHIPQNKLVFVDPKNNKPSAQMQSRIFKIISNIFSRLPDPKIVTCKIPKSMEQRDGYNCGVICLDIIRYFLSTRQFPLSYNPNISRSNILALFKFVKETNKIHLNYFYNVNEYVQIPPLLPPKNLDDEYSEILENENESAIIEEDERSTEVLPTDSKRNVNRPVIKILSPVASKNVNLVAPINNDFASAKVRKPDKRGIRKQRFKKLHDDGAPFFAAARALRAKQKENGVNKPDKKVSAFLSPKQIALKQHRAKSIKKAAERERLKVVRKTKKEKGTSTNNNPLPSSLENRQKYVPIKNPSPIAKKSNTAFKAVKIAEQELRKALPGQFVEVKILLDKREDARSKLTDLKMLVNGNFKKKQIDELSKQNKSYSYNTLMDYADEILPKIPDVICDKISSRKNLIFKDFYIFFTAVLNMISTLPTKGPIRATFSGDTGENTTNLNFSYNDVKNPQSPSNYYTFCMYDVDDSRKNLIDILNHVNEAIQRLQKEGVIYKGKHREIEFFVSGDCKFLSGVCGCQGGNSKRFCLYCKTMDVRDLGDLRSVEEIAANWSSVMSDFENLQKKNKNSLNILQKQYYSVCGTSLLPAIPLTRVVPPPLHLCMALVNKFVNFINCKQSSFGTCPRKEFNGNSCRKILEKFRIKGGQYKGPSAYRNVFTLIANVENYAKAVPLTSIEIEDLEKFIKELFDELDKYENFKQGNKLHITRHHVVPFVKLHGSWGIFGEQGQESKHPVINEKKGRIIAEKDDETKNQFAFKRLIMKSFIQHM